MPSRSYLVTGGTGFLGSALVKRLVRSGARVRVFDNGSRGSTERLGDVAKDVEVVVGDIRDDDAVEAVCRGIDSVFHLAYVNGTRYFYEQPELVLDVGVRGMLNVLSAASRHSVGELFVASSSEVYGSPDRIPTDETASLQVPDPLNPRYSYSGGKILSELLTITFGRHRFERAIVFRPHNVYGPDMGWDHVIPELAVRAADLARTPGGPLHLPIQGTGDETRAFLYIEDLASGLMLLLERGEHLSIYNIGTEEETTIRQVAGLIAAFFGRDAVVIPSPSRAGSVRRRCPDTTKIRRLGFRPQTPLGDGIHRTVAWYADHPTPVARAG